MLDQDTIPTEETKKDNGEMELPETVYVRDIENRVFQAIVLQCLARINGISLLEGNFIDTILGRDRVEGVRGIHAEQDSKNRSVNVKVEVNVRYGLPIPEKAGEIQNRISQEITLLTGLHVACVHVVFKNVLLAQPPAPVQPEAPKASGEDEQEPVMMSGHLDEELTKEF